MRLLGQEIMLTNCYMSEILVKSISVFPVQSIFSPRIIVEKNFKQQKQLALLHSINLHNSRIYFLSLIRIFISLQKGRIS